MAGALSRPRGLAWALLAAAVAAAFLSPPALAAPAIKRPVQVALHPDTDANLSFPVYYDVNEGFDTATEIAEGDMRSDCADFEQLDQNGGVLRWDFPNKGGAYGCNSANTEVWVLDEWDADGNVVDYVGYSDPSDAVDSNNNRGVWVDTDHNAVYHFAEASLANGDTARDSAGNADGTVTASSDRLVAGYFGGGFSASSGQYVSVPGLDAFSDQAFSISFWAKKTAALQGGDTFFALRHNSGGVSSGVAIDTDGTNMRAKVNAGGSEQLVTSASGIPLDEWVFWVIVFNNGDVNIYKNGASDKNGTYTGTIDWGNGVSCIGTRGGGASPSCNNDPGPPDAVIDELRVHNNALSSIEVKNLYYTATKRVVSVGDEPVTAGSIDANLVVTSGLPLAPLDPDAGTNTVSADFNTTGTVFTDINMATTSFSWTIDGNGLQATSEGQSYSTVTGFDFNTATARLPSEDYNVAVTITANDTGGSPVQSSAWVLVHVRERPQDANFTGPLTLRVGEDGFFSATATDDNAIKAYTFNFGDGNYSQGQSLYHRWSTPGDYTVSLVVTDNEDLNSSQTVQQTVKVYDYNANISMTPNQLTPLDRDNGVDTTSADFNDSSLAQNITATAWEWRVDGNLASTDQNMPGFDFNAPPGDYNVSLTVTFQAWPDTVTDTAWRIVHVREYPQDLNFTWTPYKPKAGDAVDFAATVDTNQPEYIWQFDADGNGSNSATQTHAFPTAGQKKVYLTVSNADDLNRTIQADLNVVGSFRVQFWVEDKPLTQTIVPDTVTFAGQAQTLSADAVLYLDINQIENGRNTLVAKDANYGTRSWTWDFNDFTVIDKNLVLKPAALGTDINFQIHSPDNQVLTDTPINIDYSGVASAGRAYTSDPGGYASFFLDTSIANKGPPDINYVMEIGSSAEPASDGNTYKYASQTVVVHSPKDAMTSKDINAPWSLQVTGLASLQIDNNALQDANVLIFANTVDFYLFRADANTSWLPRTLVVRVFGDPVPPVEITPYLVPVANAIQPVFKVEDKQDGSPVKGVAVVFFRAIGGKGKTQVAGGVSDNTGSLIASLVDSAFYEIQVIQGTSLLPFTADGKTTGSFQAINNQYYIRIDKLALVQKRKSNLDFNAFIAPATDVLSVGDQVDANGDFTIRFQVTPTGNAVAQAVTFKAVHAGSTLYSKTYSSNLGFGVSDKNTIDINGLDNARALHASITIQTSDGNLVFTRSWVLPGGVAGPGALAQNLKDFAAGFLGIVTAAVASVAAIMVTGFAATRIGFNLGAAVAITLLVLAGFASVGFVPWGVWMLAAVGGVALFVLTGRQG